MKPISEQLFNLNAGGRLIDDIRFIGFLLPFVSLLCFFACKWNFCPNVGEEKGDMRGTIGEDFPLRCRLLNLIPRTNSNKIFCVMAKPNEKNKTHHDDPVPKRNNVNRLDGFT